LAVTSVSQLMKKQTPAVEHLERAKWQSHRSYAKTLSWRTDCWQDKLTTEFGGDSQTCQHLLSITAKHRTRIYKQYPINIKAGLELYSPVPGGLSITHPSSARQ
jgi:hypothetical protein